MGVPHAERMFVRHGGGRRTQLLRSALSMAYRSGLIAWTPQPRLCVTVDPAGIERHLAEVMGCPVRLGVLLGPVRANLKPVVQVFSADGNVLAFAKVATSPLTTKLLENEAAALQQLSSLSLPQVVLPRLLDIALWRDHLVLVQQALPSAQAGHHPTRLPTSALAAILACGGLRRVVLGTSTFWARVSQPGPTMWHGIDVSAMARLVEAINPRTECVFGAWHGDFGTWNAAWGTEELEVWDWERFERDVPAGLDAAHWRVQMGMGKDPSNVWELMRSDVAQVLEVLGIDTGNVVPGACYVLAIWTRYRADAIDSATPALKKRVKWLCKVAEAAIPTLVRDSNQPS